MLRVAGGNQLNQKHIPRWMSRFLLTSSNLCTKQQTDADTINNPSNHLRLPQRAQLRIATRGATLLLHASCKTLVVGSQLRTSGGYFWCACT